MIGFHAAAYECPTCGATAEIIDRHRRGQFPDRVPCGWRGCPDWRVRVREAR